MITLLPLILLVVMVLTCIHLRARFTKGEIVRKTLAKQQVWFSTIQSGTPVMLHSIDQGGLLISVSDYWLEKLGYSRDEVLGRSSAEFFSAESRERAQQLVLPQFFKTGFCQDIPYQVLTRDGKILDVLLSAIGERDDSGRILRSFAIMVDVTEQKRAEANLVKAYDELDERVKNRTAALNEAYERLVLEVRERKRAEIILRTIAEGVSGTTGEAFFTSLVQYLSKALDMEFAMIGKFSELNREEVHTIAFCAHGKIQENFYYQLEGTPCAKATEHGMCLFPQNAHHLFPDDGMLAKNGINSYIGTRLNDSAGKPIGLLIVMGQSPSSASGTVTSMLQIFASRVAAEMERIKQEEELMRVRNLESLGRMAAGIAHEINNPLTNASINIQILRKKLGYYENESLIFRRMDAVERNIDRASNIAKELLLFSRDRDIDMEPADLSSVIEKAFSQITYNLEGINVHMELATGCEILGNSLKLEGLFINLFNNAIEAMPNGGVLSISTRIEGNKLIAEVRDSGVGIPREHRAKIFDPFFTTKEVGSGTGLGLSISYGIVRQHNGSIEAVDSDGGGTTILVTLPVLK